MRRLSGKDIGAPSSSPSLLGEGNRRRRWRGNRTDFGATPPPCFAWFPSPRPCRGEELRCSELQEAGHRAVPGRRGVRRRPRLQWFRFDRTILCDLALRSWRTLFAARLALAAPAPAGSGGLLLTARLLVADG